MGKTYKDKQFMKDRINSETVVSKNGRKGANRSLGAKTKPRGGATSWKEWLNRDEEDMSLDGTS